MEPYTMAKYVLLLDVTISVSTFPTELYNILSQNINSRLLGILFSY